MNLTIGSINTFDSTTGNITFGKTIDGSGDLNLTANSGTVTFNDALGGTTLLNSLTSNAIKTNVNQNISATGNIAFNSPVQLTAASQQTLNSTTGNISFSSRVDGASDLTLTAKAGTVTLGDAVGGTTPLNSLISNAIKTNVASNISTKTAPLQFNSSVTLTGAGAKIFNANNSDISFSSTLDGSGGLTLNNGTGKVTFGDNITGIGGLTIANTGGTTVPATINTTNGDINITSPITVNGKTSFDAGSGTIAINESFQANGNDITLTADVINLTNNKTALSSNGQGVLILQTSTPDLDFNIGSTFNSDGNEKGVFMAANSINGFSSITIGNKNPTSTSAINISSVNFNDPVSIQAPNGSISVDGDITGNASLSLNTSLTILKKSITTNNKPINIPNKVLIGDGANVTLTTGGGDIIFGQTVDQKTVNGNGNLTLTAGNGKISFGGDIGSIAPLGSFTIVSASSANIPGAIATTNDINIKIPLDLTGSGKNLFTSTTGNISLEDTVNGKTDLTLNAGKDVTFSNAVGGTTPLTSLTSNANNTNIANNISATGDLAFNSSINLTGKSPQALTSITGNINFGNPLDGASALTLNAAKEVTFNGAVGGTTKLNSLTSNAQKTNIANNISTTTGTLQFNSPVTLIGSGAKTFDASNSDINFTSTLDGSGNLTLNNGTGKVTFDDNITGIGGLNITNSGGTTVPAQTTIPNGDININSPVSVKGDTTFNAGTGTIAINSLNANGYNIGLTADNINLTQGTWQSINETSNLTLQPFTPTQNLNIGNSVNGQGIFIADNANGFKSVTIGGIDSSGTFNINSTTFNDLVTIQSPGGNINVNGAITGKDNSSITLISNLTTLNTNISTNNQPIDIPNKVALGTGANVALNTGDGNITFGNTVDGGGNLSLSAGQGDISFASDIGALTPLSSITINTAKTTTIPGNIITNGGNITLNIPFIVAGTGNKIINAGTGAIAFNSTLDVGNNDLTLISNGLTFGDKVTSTGNLQLQPGAANTNIILGGNTAASAGTISLTTPQLEALQNGFKSINIGRDDGSGTITLDAGGVTFKQAVKIETPKGLIQSNGTITGINNATIDLTATNLNLKDVTTNNQNINLNGNINFGSDTTLNAGAATLNIQGQVLAGNNALTLSANQINLPSAANSVIGTGNLQLQPGTPEQNINIAGTDNSSNSLDLTLGKLASLGNNFNSITIGRSDGSGAIAINPVSFANPIKIQSPNGSITAQGKITGTNNASINLTAKDITVTDITTNNNNITIDGNTSLTNPTTFDAGTATIGITGKLATGNNDLTLTANEIDLPTTNNSFSGTGKLLLQPTIATRNIILGDASNIDPNSLNLTTTDLASFATGFNSITVGRSNSSGVVTINPITLNNPLIIQSNVEPGVINANGTITGVDTGGVTLLSNQSVTTKDITAAGGDIKISSQIGSITTGDLTSNLSGKGNGNSINLSANTNITTGNISTQNMVGNAGTVTLNSAAGVINTKNINSGTTTGNGGAVSIKALNNPQIPSIPGVITVPIPGISTGDINSSTTTGNSGAVTALAHDEITVGAIKTSSRAGNGGDVSLGGDASVINIGSSNNLSANYKNIQVKSINAQGGGNGNGGIVNISTRKYFLATDTFVDQNGIKASISTADKLNNVTSLLNTIDLLLGKTTINPGAITINHGGNSGIPFIVGNPTTNGTAGAITTGSLNTISTTQYFPSTRTIGKIHLVTQGQFLSFRDELAGVQQGIGQISSGSTLKVRDNANPDKAEEQAREQFQSLRPNASFAAPSKELLEKFAQETKVKSAIFYINFTPRNPSESQKQDDQAKDDYVLDITLMTPGSLSIHERLLNVTRKDVLKVVRKFRSEISNPGKAGTNSYLDSSKQLYEWLIKDHEEELRKQGINNLMFVMDQGLDISPVAALSDGKQFLIEKYSLALLPSFKMTDITYVGIKKEPILAMGSAKFTPDQGQKELNAVPLELSQIEKISGVSALRDQNFTLENVKAERQKKPYKIIHLATHADFPNQRDGGRDKAYIQLYNQKLRLNEIPQLGWDKPQVELLVLSACKSALGDGEAELGFAGLALQTGVKSAVASLWYVSDPGTLGLMTEFYGNLNTVSIKSQALQEAQIAMIQGKVRIEGERFIGSRGSSVLTSAQAQDLKSKIEGNLSHPYYWAAFTVVGSPW